MHLASTTRPCLIIVGLATCLPGTMLWICSTSLYLRVSDRDTSEYDDQTLLLSYKDMQTILEQLSLTFSCAGQHCCGQELLALCLASGRAPTFCSARKLCESMPGGEQKRCTALESRDVLLQEAVMIGHDSWSFF